MYDNAVERKGLTVSNGYWRVTWFLPGVVLCGCGIRRNFAVTNNEMVELQKQ